MLELHLSLPPLSTSSLSLQFNRAYLKWTEHKPDAHHGFYVKSVTERAMPWLCGVMCCVVFSLSSAVITAVLSECLNCTTTMSSDQE